MIVFHNRRLNASLWVVTCVAALCSAPGALQAQDAKASSKAQAQVTVEVNSSTDAPEASSEPTEADRYQSPGSPDSSKTKSNSQSLTSRSVSVNENGQQVSISEDSRNGITVKFTDPNAEGDKEITVKAADAKQLAKKNKKAYQLYEKYLGSNDYQSPKTGKNSTKAKSNARASGSASASGVSGGNARGNNGQGPGNAIDMLRGELQKLRAQNAGNPQIQDMIDKALGDLNR